MGLDTSHDCWHGGYTAFMVWRRWVAERAGYPPLDMMRGFQMEGQELPLWIEASGLRYGFGKHKPIRPISWQPMAGDPLAILLSHSDCDGRIRWWDAEGIARRLLEVVREVKEDPDPREPHEARFATAALRFARGLLRAHAAREDVEFR